MAALEVLQVSQPVLLGSVDQLLPCPALPCPALPCPA